MKGWREALPASCSRLIDRHSSVNLKTMRNSCDFFKCRVDSAALRGVEVDRALNIGRTRVLARKDMLNINLCEDSRRFLGENSMNMNLVIRHLLSHFTRVCELLLASFGRREEGKSFLRTGGEMAPGSLDVGGAEAVDQSDRE